ncbi:hypothetical protein MCU_00372 [Bartonella elizabethae Re6043vi]|uniref:Uncharacterized protein n=2 Tax=Bartonella elizabethae TaxID=807 RepID=J1KD53_BAREL|nr:hypothetical protein MCU_00372 [Bartonella elizabethae Re6043vi]EJF95772.1 hypothetical protein MEE_01009 [Bartonella elizabethae F9251 = ATCC 49927]VEJ41254.1 Uncharacterised protein [Bartonella elizabethae]
MPLIFHLYGFYYGVLNNKLKHPTTSHDRLSFLHPFSIHRKANATEDAFIFPLIKNKNFFPYESDYKLFFLNALFLVIFIEFSLIG